MSRLEAQPGLPFVDESASAIDRPRLPAAWEERLGADLNEAWFARLWTFVRRERDAGTVYPPEDRVFHALRLTPPDAVRVVILGQDPYHGPGQAHGLAFSVRRGVAPPPSLRNVFRELRDDVGVDAGDDGCLEPWARRGVLLLNTVLTVRRGEAGSHAGVGWERFTDTVIRAVDGSERRVVFVLWGNPARRKKRLLRTPPHAVVESPHPSPLSAHRGFLGSRPFSTANHLLEEAGRTPVDWSLDR